MTRFFIEATVETEQLTDIPILEQVLKRAIENSFFIDVKVTQLVVIRHEIPTEGIQKDSNI